MTETNLNIVRKDYEAYPRNRKHSKRCRMGFAFRAHSITTSSTWRGAGRTASSSNHFAALVAAEGNDVLTRYTVRHNLNITRGPPVRNRLRPFDKSPPDRGRS